MNEMNEQLDWSYEELLQFPFLHFCNMIDFI